MIAISKKSSNRAMADSQESAHAYQKAHLSDNKKAEIIAPTVIFLTIAYTAVFLRYKSRRIARITLEADDWCIGLALVIDLANHHWPDVDATRRLRQHASSSSTIWE